MATITSSTATPAQGGVIVTITNNLKGPVDIFDMYNPAASGQPLPFQYTKLGTIAPGATGTVTTIRNYGSLQAMYTGCIAELGNAYYYQFPVRAMSGTKPPSGKPLPAYTISETDRLASVQSLLFHKFAMANPDSSLTASLNAALKTGDIPTINTFFAGTQNFQTCTLASWNAIMIWLQQFTSGWQGPYYLYENPPSPAPEGYLPKLLATLNILSVPGNNSAVLSGCTSDAKGNPVYANPRQNTTVIMAGDGTMADANPSMKGDLSLSLTPVWMNVVQTTLQDGVAVPSYVIGSALCGTLMGTSVVSSQTARQLPGKPADPKKEGFFDSLFSSASSTLSTMVGLIMLYESVSKVFTKNQADKEAAKKDAKSDEDLKAQEDQIDRDSAAEVSAKLTSPAAAETFNKAPRVRESLTEAAKSLQAETMKQSMDEQLDAINEQVEEQLMEGATPTAKFEEAYRQMQENFSKASKLIEAGDFEGANAAIKQATSNIDTALKTNQKQLETWEKSALEESSAQLDELTKSSDTLKAEQAENEAEITGKTNDSGFEPKFEPIAVDAI
jgi:hypothetical protein